MHPIVSALWPVFALLMLGYLAKRSNFPGAPFWPMAERLIYYVLFPALLVDRLAQADMSGVSLMQVGMAVVLLVSAGTVVCFLLRPLMGLSHAGFTSFYQGSVRFNTYVGLAAVAALYSAQGVALAAVLIALLIPLLNVACITVFALGGVASGGVSGGVSLLLNILRNPLIIACLCGLMLNLTGIGLPAPVAAVTELLSRMALPLGLLAVGAGLSFKALLAVRWPVVLSALIKLLGLPLAAALIAVVLALPIALAQVLVLFAALPTAPSAYILARQLGGDAAAMAAIITGQTVLSMLTLPFILILSGNFFT